MHNSRLIFMVTTLLPIDLPPSLCCVPEHNVDDSCHIYYCDDHIIYCLNQDAFKNERNAVNCSGSIDVYSFAGRTGRYGHLSTTNIIENLGVGLLFISFMSFSSPVRVVFLSPFLKWEDGVSERGDLWLHGQKAAKPDWEARYLNPGLFWLHTCSSSTRGLLSRLMTCGPLGWSGRVEMESY